ncbi:MAG: FtsX-like permease family protein [Candidatus Bathyarchaeia archaeon]
MSETAFPVNDLLRRKLPTSLTIISLMLCVASTLLLLFFSEKLGFGFGTILVEDRLTVGFSVALSRFIIFVGILIFAVGALIISFTSFMALAQRIRDIGLMKAAGCPNSLIFGYFATELLIIDFLGCISGVILGVAVDFASSALLSQIGFQVLQKAANFWLIIPVFIMYFVFALIFGIKPILDTAKIEPAKAISLVYSLGLSKEREFKGSSKRNLMFKFALRSLSRRKSATFRIIICLATVFTLLTISVAGGIIASQTTKSWVEKAAGKNLIGIAHQEIRERYEWLLSKFYETKAQEQFNYTKEEYLIPEFLLSQLNAILGENNVDERLIIETRVQENPGHIIDPETNMVYSIGDSRRGESLVVGIKPRNVLCNWFLEGKLFGENEFDKALVGDSLAHKIFSIPLNQSITMFDKSFAVTGVCVDPINNGNVTYVHLKTLQNITGISGVNLALIRVSEVNREEIIGTIYYLIPDYFEVFELDEFLDKSLGFLNYIWSAIMLLPLFSLLSASLCLAGYVMLAITEQRQEFGVLRAVGAKPKAVVKVVSWQSITILLSSCIVGIAFGVMATLLILVPEPLVTSYTIMEIAGILFMALVTIFAVSLYPAVRFARKPVLEIIAQ